MLVSHLTSLGHCIDFNLEEAKKRTFALSRAQHTKSLDLDRCLNVFKKDFYISSFVEKISNCDVFYIRNKFGRGDELYYFSNGSVLFSEIIWSSYHPFVQKLQALPINIEIDSPSWFVGSRNNYTHQRRFYPNTFLF